MSPLAKWSSEWHIPDAASRTMASPSRGPSSSRSTGSNSPGVLLITEPRIFMRPPRGSGAVPGSTELRKYLVREELQLPALGVAGVGALVEEVPLEPIQGAVAVAAVQLLHLTLDLVDGAAELPLAVDDALRAFVLVLERDHRIWVVLLRVAERLGEPEVVPVVLELVAGGACAQLEGLLLGV